MYGGKTILFPNFEHHSTVKVAKDSGDKIDTGDQVDSEGVEVGHGETGPRATVADADERPSLDHTLSNRLKRDTNFPDTINILKVFPHCVYTFSNIMGKLKTTIAYLDFLHLAFSVT